MFLIVSTMGSIGEKFIALAFSNLACLIYYARSKRYNDRIGQKISNFNEFSTAIITLTLVFSSDMIPDPEQKFYYGFWIIILTSLSMVTNLLFNLYWAYQELRM